MVEYDFLSRSVVRQLGGFSGPVAQSDGALIRALRRSSGMAIAWCPSRQVVLSLDPDEDRLRPADPGAAAHGPKTAGALATLLEAGADFAFVVDMQDRRAKRISPDGEPAAPIFCFNRLKGDTQRILVPLPVYHDFGTGHFSDAVRPDAVAWTDKEPRLVWRGITGGRAAMDAEGLREGMRMKMALRRHREGRLSERDLRAVLMACPRYGLLERLKDDPRCDMGFVDGDGYVIAQTPLHAHLARPRMPQSAMQRFRYVAVLRGLDVGSSFYWVMNSGSLGLVMETPFETFASGHFRPDDAYLPFRMDGSDLARQLDWAEANPDRAQAMADRAAAISAFLLRADLRSEILRRLVRHISTLPRVEG